MISDVSEFRVRIKPGIRVKLRKTNCGKKKKKLIYNCQFRHMAKDEQDKARLDMSSGLGTSSSTCAISDLGF